MTIRAGESQTFGCLRNRNTEIVISAKTTPAAPVADLNFEAALRELEQIVAKLEQGEVDLEDSIALYERGQALKTHCEKKLKAAEGRLEKLVLGAAGTVQAESVGTE